MEEEVTPSFYMRSCINRNNFLLSCSRKRKSKASLLLCRVRSYQILPARRVLFVFASTGKSELCHHSGTLRSKSARAWNSLGRHFLSWAPAARNQDSTFQIHLQSRMWMNCWYSCQLGAFLVEEDHI